MREQMSETFSFEYFQEERAKQIEKLYQDKERIVAIADLMETSGWRFLVEEINEWMDRMIEVLDGIPSEVLEKDSLCWQLGQWRGARDAYRKIVELPKSCLRQVRNTEEQRKNMSKR